MIGLDCVAKSGYSLLQMKGNVMKQIFRVIMCVALFAGLPAFADMEKGFSAYRDGDYSTAFREFKPLAEEGDSSASFYVGWMYKNGMGVQQDDQEAQIYFTLARLFGGEANLNFNFAVQYNHGWGVPQDYKEAAKWYKLSAEQGYSGAQSNLGRMYQDGKGVPQDDIEGVKWLRLSAEQGNVGGQTNLGAAYRDGRGVLQDYILAHMWFNLSASKGMKHSGEQRDKVAKLMTPEQIAEAQKRAKECVAKDYKGC